MEQYQWITNLPSLCVIALIGMLMHFFKQQIKGETITEIRDYFSTHFKSTVIAFVATVLSVVAYYLSLSTGQMADIIVAIQLGYTSDSFFNKWDK